MAILPKQPDFLEMPFCTNGDKTTIPAQPLYGKASLDVGFPIETGMDLSEGGVPPDRLDFNGILNLLSQFAYWMQSGGVPTWNAKLDYVPPACVAGSDGRFYKCIAQSGPNITDVGPKDPTIEGNIDYWVVNDPGSKPDVGAIVGEIKFLPFRSNALPTGWYVTDGQLFPVKSPQGEVLEAFSDEFKTDWGIKIQDVGGVASINIPNLFAGDSTGAMLIPTKGTGLAVGGVQEDAGRNITGHFVLYNGIGFSGGASGVMYFEGSVPYCFSWHNSGPLANSLRFDASRAWGGEHTSNRFKVYGRGTTPVMFLGV